MNSIVQSILDNCKIEHVVPYNAGEYRAYSSNVSIKIPAIEGRIFFESIMKDNIIKLEIVKDIKKNLVTIREMTPKESSAAKLLPLIEKKFGQEIKMEVLRGLYVKTLDRARGEEVL